MLTRRQQVSLALLLVVVSTTAQCNHDPAATYAQGRTDQGIRAGAVASSVPALQGKAAGGVTEFKFTEERLDASLFSLSAPEVWLVFPASRAEAQPPDSSTRGADSTVRVDLSPEVRRALVSQWQAALPYFYETEIERVPDAATYFSKSVAFSNLSLTTMRLLEGFTVNAPDGKRNISADEAGELLRFINAAAADAVGQAKKHKL